MKKLERTTRAAPELIEALGTLAEFCGRYIDDLPDQSDTFVTKQFINSALGKGCRMMVQFDPERMSLHFVLQSANRKNLEFGMANFEFAKKH